MTRTIERGSKMDQIIGIKATHKDMTQLKLKAQQQGTNVSAIVRRCLIDAGLIDPL